MVFDDVDIARDVLGEAGIKLEGAWSDSETQGVTAGVSDFIFALGKDGGGSNVSKGASILSRLLGSGTTFHRVADLGDIGTFNGTIAELSGATACVCNYNHDVFFDNLLFARDAKGIRQDTVQEVDQGKEKK